MFSAAAPTTGSYEEERLENIRRNQALLRELELSSGLGLGDELAHTSDKDVAGPSTATPAAAEARQKRRLSARSRAQQSSPPSKKRALNGETKLRPLPTRRSERVRKPLQHAKVEHIQTQLSSTAVDDADFPATPPRGSVHLKKVRPPNPGSSRDVDVGILADKEYHEEEEDDLDDDIYTAPLPQRETPSSLSEGRGALKFEQGLWHFTPNLTPSEMFLGGAFGGTAFKSHYSPVLRRQLDSELELSRDALPPRARDDFLVRDKPDWRADHAWQRRFLMSDTYRPDVNRFSVKASQSLKEWEDAGWIRAQDPRGWWQWYLRFYYGRRSKDDERQIQRWLKACGPNGRFRRALAAKIASQGGEWSNATINPILRQTLWHWGYELSKTDYEKYF
ncbi:hypothetical protein K437DRAFT_292620 [Tilletiaria anomala UBC 951]|uniref:Uncharacterized protein n=1 Tax=Tilletiaria anomala (strain ATCC 24038 / CBS 436.72 / UBC 951) TaxID=1037660 RepID=A0A066WK41_TILAU|nr:uncharacterized protein K437DRAFT_292620 [Tilletiaria anomala UBC 951]KDN52933.1 hypothetical protein K437DRAFT_292620 [Tilletiaria anomala UBC 951]